MDYEFRSKLLLFLSVDIIGSTAFKNSNSSTDRMHPWLPFVNGFYNDFPIYFVRNLNNKKYQSQPPYRTPTVWKCLGDELIFVVELTDSCQPIFFISSFRDAIKEYNEEVFQTQQPKLGLKASAWLGGFPVSNAEIIIKQTGSDNKEEIDYVGPSIDIGFRLSKMADNRKMTISVELAYMISVSANTSEYNLPLYFNGRTSLKGVLNNKEYPVFWIHMLDHKEDLELQMLNIVECNKETVTKYCRRFIKDSNGLLEIPFISGDAVFRDKPLGYDEKFLKAQEAFKESYGESANSQEVTGLVSAEMADTVATNILESVRKSTIRNVKIPPQE